MQTATLFYWQPHCRSPPSYSFFELVISKIEWRKTQMKKWQMDRNYRAYENLDGSFVYIIAVDGVDVEVNKDVYMAYSQSDRRERYLA